ncbi:MAG: HAD family hydrolase [Deltaproteobacteria bacterium]|nr:HAD family hydrolase [Deltaproteobacteria bacterium]
MEPKKPQVVIFDLDGTLLNTLDDLADAANKMLRLHGFTPHPTDAYRTFVGDGLFVLIKRITPAHTSKEMLQSCMGVFQREYEGNWNNKTALYPEIDTMLNRLTELQVNIAILSNKPDNYTKKCVGEFLASHDFYPVFGQREHIERKPSPTGALEIAKKLNAAPRSCLFVGDSSVDMKTGNAAGMVSIGVSWGFRTESELLEAGAQHIIHHPLELVRYVTNP